MKRLALLLLVLSCTPALATDDAGTPDASMPATVTIEVEGPGDAGMISVTIPGDAVFVPDPDGGVGEFVLILKQGHRFVTNKEWGKLTFLIVMVLVWISRRFIGPRVPWLASGAAAIAKAFLLAAAGALATTWGAGDPLTVGDVITALTIGFSAAGGWSVLSYALEHGASRWAWVAWLRDLILGKPSPDATPTPPMAPQAK